MEIVEYAWEKLRIMSFHFLLCLPFPTVIHRTFVRFIFRVLPAVARFLIKTLLNIGFLINSEAIFHLAHRGGFGCGRIPTANKFFLYKLRKMLKI